MVMMEVSSSAPDLFSVSKLDTKKPSERKYQLEGKDADEWVEAVHQSASTMNRTLMPAPNTI